MRVLEGHDSLPTSMQAGNDRLVLPYTEAWTPSNTVVSCLQVLV
ncbi:unnamed protein product, partial [Discosporangium mesarthrocarpum]